MLIDINWPHFYWDNFVWKWGWLYPPQEKKLSFIKGGPTNIGVSMHVWKGVWLYLPREKNCPL
jgi:hypothetical protein